MSPENVIFCDEAGITGNNLLDIEQPYFVFAGVNIQADRATDLVARAISTYRLQGNELKGGRLMKHSSGRKAIEFLLQECLAQTHLVFHNKKYALASKLYQHTFDEIFADHSSLFYVSDFNRFVANAIYLGVIADHPLASSAIGDFQSLMMEKQRGSVPSDIFSLRSGDFVASLIEVIVLVCYLHKERILRELTPLLNGPSGAPDLTGKSIFSGS